MEPAPEAPPIYTSINHK